MSYKKSSELEHKIAIKRNQLRKSLADLGRKLDAGDDSELLVPVIPGALYCAHRPLRHHFIYGGTGQHFPPHATSAVFEWVERVRDFGIRGIICLLSAGELRHYSDLALGASDLIRFYENEGFAVRHIPWDDPEHNLDSKLMHPERVQQNREKALHAFDAIEKPVLLHCSAGIDRSSPVAAYIFVKRAGSNIGSNKVRFQTGY